MKKICLECFTLEELIEILRKEFSNSYTAKVVAVKNNDLLTRKQAAGKLQITLPTLNSWTKQQKIIAYRSGSRIYYKENELLASLQKVNHLKYKKGIE